MVNRKTENRQGVRFGNWQGVVVSVDDPLKSGRVQVRIYGDNDDKTNCSDSNLFWSHPSSPIQSASCNHKGWSPTGVRVGSTAKGYFGDVDKQVPVFGETQYRSSIPTPGSGDWSQIASPDGVNDVSPNARGIASAGVQGEKNYGGDLFYGSKPVSLYNLATDATLGGGGSSVPQSYQKMKSGGLPTIANTAFESGQKILNIINQVDPKNSSGAIQSALQGMMSLKNLTSAASSMSGGDMFSSLFNGLLQSAMGGGGGGGGGGGSSSAQSPINTSSATSTPSLPNISTSLITSTTGASTTIPQLQSGASTNLNQTIQAYINTLITSPWSVPVGTGTQDNSLINSSQNTAPTAQSGQTPSQGSGGGGGGGGGGGQLASMAQQIIQQLISSFNGAGDTGGLATYNQQQGALVKMEQAVKQLFSNMQDSPNNPGTQQGNSSDSNS